jgi:hypothetical protein
MYSSRVFLILMTKNRLKVSLFYPRLFSLITICLSLHNPLSHASLDDNSPHNFDIQTTLLAQHHTSDKTWLASGLGRYDLSSNNALAELQLSYQYKFSSLLSFQTHIQAQQATETNSANSLGLVEFKLNYSNDLDWNQSISITAGQFFLPISMENTLQFWESPYTLHFSSLNSWIGEEFRPIGLDGEYLYILDNNDRLSFAATLFGGNDSMGSLLAYRGWSLGRQRSVLGDVISIPKLSSLDGSGELSGQRDDGTRPFGKDLDNRPGYALRSQYSSKQLILSLAWIDSRGDRELHQGEYAWDTRFAVFGAAWLVNDHWELLAEAMQGSTTMGAGPGVDIDFYSAYFMSSILYGDKRISLRLELFGSEDLDPLDEDNHDLGRAITIASFWQPAEQNFQLGVETIYLNSKRTKSTTKGFQTDSESISLSFLGSYFF